MSHWIVRSSVRRLEK